MLTRLKINITHRVDMCMNGEEAMNVMLKSYEAGMSYQLILMDFNMPVMDGITSTRKMRELFKENGKYERSTSKQPTILGLSANVLLSEEEKGLNAGMNQVLSKPLYFDVLNDALNYYNIII